MKKPTQHIFLFNGKLSSFMDGSNTVLFQNHPNLLKRDNYPSTKLQRISEIQGIKVHIFYKCILSGSVPQYSFRESTGP